MNKIKSILTKIVLSIIALMLLTYLSYAQTQGDIDSECTDLKTNLRLRSSDNNQNKDVTKLQKYLFENKFLNISPTGFFGSKTKQAVSDYQKSINLVGTGFVGPLTRAAIKKDTCDGNVSDSGPVSINNQAVITATNTNVINATSTFQVGVGRVLDDGGNPVKGAEVACGFLSGGNSVKNRMITDENGLFYPKLTNCFSSDFLALSSCPKGYTPYGLVGGSGSSVTPINANGREINTGSAFTCKKDVESDRPVEITSMGNEGKIPFWVDVYCGGQRLSNAGMRVVDTYGPEYVFPSNCAPGTGEMSLRATGVGFGYSAVKSEIFYKDRAISTGLPLRDQILFTINKN